MLMKVATNLALNHLRSQKRQPVRLIQPTSPSDDDDESLVPGWLIDQASAGPMDLLHEAEQHQAMGEMINALPPAKREVMRLVHHQQMNIEEAADELGIAPGTVRSHLHYARHKLADAWRQRFSGDTDQ